MRISIKEFSFLNFVSGDFNTKHVYILMFHGYSAIRSFLNNDNLNSLQNVNPLTSKPARQFYSSMGNLWESMG